MTNQFQPISGKHAIEACTSMVLFPQPVGSETFTAIAELARSLASKNNLPATREMSVPEMFGNIFPASLPGQTTGIMFQRFASDGTIVAELKCERNAVTLLVRDYDRWATLRVTMDAVLAPLIPLYTSELSAIHSVRLQYDDRFVRDVNLGAGQTSEMFRRPCEWITLPAPEMVGDWHSHFGIFNKHEDIGRELINVNATVQGGVYNSTPSQSVGVTILVGEFFDVVGEQPLIVDSATSGSNVTDLLEKCHKRHRAILEEVLTEEYLKAIGARE